MCVNLCVNRQRTLCKYIGTSSNSDVWNYEKPIGGNTDEQKVNVQKGDTEKALRTGVPKHALSGPDRHWGPCGSHTAKKAGRLVVVSPSGDKTSWYAL